ncbi:carboxypeptidase M32 [Sinisalibacter aestuarii]|uniref:Metal-dependent carboxypeptidase n=1 Tax=Sinisalibacter aestuarii TaxID=2949426 RepID=A0ABQ5LSN7_9RHOB|nr:carboxypeptidase M32 [Sinisalibacter aestuarii]GKY87633.1 carboxypeptidase Taq [Sinisalibacter aestuarii]
MSAYEELMAFDRQTQALRQIAGRLGWDQETVMPRAAAPQRAEESEAMEQVLHARRTDPRLGDWLAAIDEAALDQVGRANLRHIRRSFTRATRVPARLAGELARVTSEAQGQWAEARAADDFAGFAPVLARIVALKREEAAALAAGGDLYDALLDDYEPGATGAELQAMFDALRPRLVDLRARILGAAHQPAALTGSFDEQAQMKLTRRLAKAFGYDMAHGRIDKAVHPFSSGSGLDVRITTRTNPEDPFGAVYSTIHETGHACYEQHIDPAYLLTPLGAGVSMGVHESQSRIYENQLGRSRAFTGWLFGEFKGAFGDLALADAEAFYAAANRVHPGFIRTESDEVQYNLHVLLRFDLERQMIAGTLDVADLEEAWNSRFEADFGVKVERASQGCLQDVHWSVGLFGYFPTYSLGNVYAGCLHKALRADMPDLDTHLAAGDAAKPTEWLADRLQRHGGLYEPKEVITLACGEAPGEGPLLDYLEAKFSEIYRL